MKNSVLVVLAMLVAGGVCAQTSGSRTNMHALVSSLLKRMTLEEKIGQLNLLSVGFDVTGPVMSKGAEAKIRNGLVGGVFNTYTPIAVRKLQELAVQESRLHIPLLFGYDVIHGHKTIFPIPLGLSCTWDMGLIEQSARIAATEATADGLNWTFSPMVDIARDPRWGRIAEGAGEDPYLGSQVAQAMVRGYQGPDLSRSDAILACVKHFALYGAAEAGRDYNTVDMSRLRMYQDYLPPYHAAVQAGVGSVMASFNEVDGVPATGNHWLLTDLLRKQWGFDGFVVTDYTAINEMSQHGTGTVKQNAARALNAGVDMDMVSEAFSSTLKQALAEGTIRQATVDQACRRILEAKFKLGLFADPYARCNLERAQTQILTEANRAAARQMAERSFVLLKNSGHVLPLKKSGSVALVGPLASNQRELLGSWRAAGDWKQAVSVFDGITHLAGPAVSVQYAPGANLIDDPVLLEELNADGAGLTQDKRSPQELRDEAVALAARSDVVVAVLGETSGMTGEAASRSDLGLPENQEDLLRALVQTGKPVVLVLMNGRPLTLTWEDAHCTAILETWFGGLETGHAVARVLFGEANPCGKLTTTFPRSVGQVPIYYSHKNTGRPYQGDPRAKYVSRYLDVSNDPLYPFGYGLSYSSFEFSNVRLSKTSLAGNEPLQAAVTVTNTSVYAGRETVQLYISQPVGSVTRSVLELKEFQQIELRPGESKEVVFHITPEQLKFYNSDLKYDWEPGEFFIRIGPDSAHLKSASVHWSKSGPVVTGALPSR